MDQVAEIKQKLNVVDIVGNYVALKKAGKNYKGLCPFHTEKTPSFMVSPELQIYKCFGCGKAGDIISFIQEMEGMEFPQALEFLAEKAGVTLEKRGDSKKSAKKKIIYEINHLTMEFYHKLLVKHPAGKKAREYLKKKRKISDEIIEEFKLGYAPDSWDLLLRFLKKNKYIPADMLLAGVITPKKSGKGFIDKFRGRIVFPFVAVNGKVIGFSGRTLFDRVPKYLNTSETMVFHKSHFVYGLNKTRAFVKKEGAVFVEGPTDVLSAFQADIKNVVATSGTSLTLGQLDLIARYTKDITFCFDSDSAGVLAARRAATLAEQKGFNIRIALLPEKYKDLDELVHVSAKQAKKVFKEAIPIYDFFLMLALKKYGCKGPIEKRKVVEELTPVFADIKDPVILEHYVKRLSKEIDIREDILATIFKGNATTKDFTSSFGKRKESATAVKKDFSKTKEAYTVALLLKVDIDILTKFIYKLGRKDFSRAPADLQKIFREFKKFVRGKETFDIQGFIDTIDDDLSSVVQELYLWDVGDSKDKVEKELEAVVTFLKRESARDAIGKLSEELKLAEMAKDTVKVKTLTKKIKKFTKELI